MAADAAEPVPFYTETSARVDGEVATHPTATWNAPTGLSAVAVVHPTKSSLAKGTLKVVQKPDGSTLSLSVDGLVPGVHEVRVHSSGDCSDEWGESAGAPFAFNPVADNSRPGLLMTLEVGEDWRGRAEADVSGLTLSGETSVVGRSLVIHLVQPDGAGTDAGPGAVMACGTIGVA